MGDTPPAAIPPPRGPLWTWWVCGLLLLATTVNYLDRLTLNQTSLRIMADFRMDPGDYGELESCFAFAFALGSIVAGWLADRWGVRWLYPAAVVAWSAAGLATGLVNSFTGLLLCRVLLGLAEGGNWPCALRTTQHVLPPAQRSLGNGILQSGAAVGAVLTPLLVLWLVSEPAAWHQAVGLVAGGLPLAGPVYRPGAWRILFVLVGLLGLAWAGAWLLTVRRGDLATERRPSPPLAGLLAWLVFLFGADLVLQLVRGVYHDARADDPVRVLLEGPWLTLAVKVSVAVLGIAAVCRWLLRNTARDAEGEPLARKDFLRRFVVLLFLVVSINTTWHFFRPWLPLFLQKQHHYGEAEVEWFTTAYYLSTDAGSLLCGFAALWLARRTGSVHGSRVVVFAACALLTTLSVLAAVLPKGDLLLGVLLVVGFAALGLFPVYYSFSQELTTRHQGKLTGSIGCINWLVMYLLQAAVGEYVKQTGSYSLGVAAAGLAPLVGLAALLLLWGKTPPAAEKPAAQP
jgi:ACS family hexuronate transporter-like MFS transporter